MSAARECALCSNLICLFLWFFCSEIVIVIELTCSMENRMSSQSASSERNPFADSSKQVHLLFHIKCKWIMTSNLKLQLESVTNWFVYHILILFLASQLALHLITRYKRFSYSAHSSVCMIKIEYVYAVVVYAKVNKMSHIEKLNANTCDETFKNNYMLNNKIQRQQQHHHIYIESFARISSGYINERFK